METKNDRAIRPAELQKILGLSRSSIHRLEVSGVLPKKRKYGAGSSTFYLESEIVEFLKSQPQVDTGIYNNNKITPQAA